MKTIISQLTDADVNLIKDSEGKKSIAQLSLIIGCTKRCVATYCTKYNIALLKRAIEVKEAYPWELPNGMFCVDSYGKTLF